MNIPSLLEILLAKQDLSPTQMQTVMQAIMEDKLSEIEITAFLIALKAKSESVEELTVAATVMRQFALSVALKKNHFIDIVGTGGDQLSTFNISTAACFVVAAAGGTIVKHGNRAASSNSGAADVLEAAGYDLNTPKKTIEKMIEDLGIGFLFAQNFHPAMQKVKNLRKQLKVRTIFNLLGPLTNPAGASHHLIGVYEKRWLEPFAKVLQNLNSKKALIVHGSDGLDEITLTGDTYVTELSDNRINSYALNPQDFDIKIQPLTQLQVQSAKESLQMIHGVFKAKPGPALDIVCLNAGAALYAAALADSIGQGVEKCQRLIRSGEVKARFEAFITSSNAH